MTIARGDLPVLNRQASLVYTVPGGVGPTPHLYRINVASDRLNFQAGEWSVYLDTGNTNSFGNPIYEDIRAPAMASEMIRGTFIEVALTDSNGLVIDPQVVDVGGMVYVLGPGAAQVVWTSTFVNRRTSHNYIGVTVEGGILTGPDFEITSDGGLSIGYSEITSVRAGAEATLPVWCRITERGSETGLLAIQADDSSLTISESATFVIRFIVPTVAGAFTTITDEYGRVWSVNGSRAILDRRYLALECTR